LIPTSALGYVDHPLHGFLIGKFGWVPVLARIPDLDNFEGGYDLLKAGQEALDLRPAGLVFLRQGA